MVPIQHTWKQWIEHTFALEADDSNTTCGNRHNKLPERAIRIVLLPDKSILAQAL